MVKLQVDIPEELNKELKVYKLRHGHVTIADATVDILGKFFTQFDSDYFIKANEKESKASKEIADKFDKPNRRKK